MTFIEKQHIIWSDKGQDRKAVSQLSNVITAHFGVVGSYFFTVIISTISVIIYNIMYTYSIWPPPISAENQPELKGG